ncbi:MAG: protein adenylyltransferase SelO family protein, partial [Ilumatobacteraceae bacterium]
TVFSSIDHGGRYAYGNQPAIATWNLARLGESLLPLLDDDADRAVELATHSLQRFPEQFQAAWLGGMCTKLGLVGDRIDGSTGTNAAERLIADLLTLMGEQRVDFTSCLRSLSSAARGDVTVARSLFAEPAAFDAWAARWLPLVTSSVADGMDRANPIYIPRNHLVEAALSAATAGDLQPFEQLMAVLADPYTEREGLEHHSRPAPDTFTDFQTFCGT